MDIKDIKILICDDSFTSRKKLRDFIETLGCVNLFDAENGEEAVNQYKAISPNIVFMDIVMPRMDGIEALKRILEYDSEAVVIMASSVGTQAHLKAAIQAGAKDFLQKPLNAEQISSFIETYCNEGGDE